MEDFEVLKIGSQKKLNTYMALIEKMEQVGEQYGFGIFPQSVLDNYIHSRKVLFNEDLNKDVLVNKNKG